MQPAQQAFQQWFANDHQSELVKGFFTPSASSPSLIKLQRQARSLDIVAETVRMIGETHIGSSDIINRHDHIRFQRAVEFIHSQAGQAINVIDIAREAGICPTGLQRLFRQLQGCSVIEYVRQARLEQAKHALKAGHLSVKEISATAGYKNPANFATAFKRQFGITPKQAASQVTSAPLYKR